jgi:hypothetical protein
MAPRNPSGADALPERRAKKEKRADRLANIGALQVSPALLFPNC